MASQKQTEQQRQYNELEKKHELKRPILKNCIRAFLVGGFICIVGQALSYFYIYFFNFTEKTAGNPTVATMVFLSMLLTGFGIYDRLGQFAGAGSAVPVTGFGNSVVSAAIEHRTEGYVLGVGANMFKLAGTVIVYGVFSAFVVVLIRSILLYWR
ncbi:stage V sporulation protein AC [Heyndrickxia ginsengihumi]|uniref:Stage V sporulation protein AC n=1 Tax=Heyndrickxia ginsengihumi TaxID=363870 RepID=A0A6M0P6A0_9BACI|nr:stage V sporulation protein AC [Heyndrickxia ginsengihumi]MBE6185622.1 stage V sporulation protein AC [Bacillus sp. (in: firmicutes)]MCM3024589.1 stage V sporulation protein AC [Heyndrickxia ginsengihumi]NEY18798.1 stage V sporulation protein AC [Heyndrickxia ginsengihumi]